MIFDKLFEQAMHGKRVEPKMRNKDGMKWIVHRFPIKDGISMTDLLERSITQRESILCSLKKQK